MIASAVFGLATLGALWRQFGGRRVRVLAGATVLSVLVGWGVAQYPYVLPTTLTIDQAAAPNSVLLWLLVTFILFAVTVIPTLLLLWYLDQRSRLDEGTEMPGSRARHRVVIVGGGFGGLFATKSLAMGPVDVTLVDRHNYHLFQPLLYQVSTGILSEGQIGPALRDVTRNTRNCRVELAEVTGFDLDKHTLAARDPLGKPMEIPYDSLIVAAGRADVVLRQRPVRALRPGHEDDRRRPRAPPPHLRRLRARRARGRSRGEATVAHVRGRRRRADRV